MKRIDKKETLKLNRSLSEFKKKPDLFLSLICEKLRIRVVRRQHAPRDVDDLFLHPLRSHVEGGEKKTRSRHTVQAMN